MKLELKHLAPYLPYGLKVIHNEDIDGVKYKPVNITDRFYSIPTAILTNFKPILRPVSDLQSDEFDMDDVSKGAILFLDKTANLPYNSRESHIGSIQYRDMLKLLKWHFDIFGLIPKGLAIDIDTLTT